MLYCKRKSSICVLDGYKSGWKYSPWMTIHNVCIHCAFTGLSMIWMELNWIDRSTNKKIHQYPKAKKKKGKNHFFSMIKGIFWGFFFLYLLQTLLLNVRKISIKKDDYYHYKYLSPFITSNTIILCNFLRILALY